ncbi:putative lipoprotein, partial [Bifidobacterium saguini DSM 23967]
MRMPRRLRRSLCALLLAFSCLACLAGCGGPDFGSFADELTFGDEEVSDVQTTYVMRIPEGGLGDLIGPNQIQWTLDNYGSTGQAGVTPITSKKAARRFLMEAPQLQCTALQNTYQKETSDEGSWVYRDSSCVKQRTLSWLEKTLWGMYEKQSDETIEWLSTSRNTLVAADGTVSTLHANASPDYDDWFTPANRYLRVAQGVLVVAAAVSLCVLSARIVWNVADGMKGPLLDKAGWIFLGVLLGSSSASIALTFFSRSSGSNPSLPSWTPSGAWTQGGVSFFLSDWVRMQIDPFLILAAVCGVMAAGWKLVTQQEGRGLVPLGKAFMWAILTSVCLAGMVNTFQSTFDSWTAGVLRSASGMMNDAWEANTLAASQFFDLGAPVAIVLTIVVWICGLISKVFCYLRAGLLPILVGVAPMWAALSWTEQGRQSFAKTLGWLAAFLFYKPVAALVMATGSAIMTTAGAGDDSQAITLMLTLSVIILLPAMIRMIVPAVQSSVGGGGGGIMPSVLGMGAAG